MLLAGYVMLAMAMWLPRRDWLVLTERERVTLLDSERLRRASGMLLGSRLLCRSLDFWMAAGGVGLSRETLLLFGPITVEGRLWRETLLTREPRLLACFEDGATEDVRGAGAGL
jgi:hypothetical protein